MVDDLMPDDPWIVAVLDTRLTSLLGIVHPIVQAGMGYLARQDLAAAVSDAGALGGHREHRGAHPRPAAERDSAGQGADHAAVRDESAVPTLRLAVPHRRPFGGRAAGQGRCRDRRERSRARRRHGRTGPERVRGVQMLGDVHLGATRHAQKAQNVGADVLVAQGREADEHNSQVASRALLPQVCRIARVPIAAAGGIGGGAGLAVAVRVDGEIDSGPIPVGQIADYLQGPEKAPEVVARSVREARTTLSELQRR